jgi:hypothetical protein
VNPRRAALGMRLISFRGGQIVSGLYTRAACLTARCARSPASCVRPTPRHLLLNHSRDGVGLFHPPHTFFFWFDWPGLALASVCHVQLQDKICFVCYFFQKKIIVLYFLSYIRLFVLFKKIKYFIMIYFIIK